MMLDSIIIGAGQAGLGVSYYLKRNGFKHIVFEKGRIGESWLSMRWDSFTLNTPNFMNVLPDFPYEGKKRDGFVGVNDLIHYFQEYIDKFQLPVKTGSTVMSVERSHGNAHFVIRIKDKEQFEETVLSRSVVVASGIQRVPKYPSINFDIPAGITSLHSADYRNAVDLPSGAVVIIGCGQTGCQIAEDLLNAGKTVYLCTSKVGRVPRRYRGKDIVEWWIDTKFWDVEYDKLEDKSVSRIPQPQVSGVGRYGHTVSLQYLAQKGAVILGRLTGFKGNKMLLGDDAAANVQFADNFSKKVKGDIEAYLLRNSIDPQPNEDDPADLPDSASLCASRLRKLDIRDANISAIVWATGFKGDFSWLNLPVLDDFGNPVHKKGISPVQGLYFIGFPWLNSRKSGILYGIQEDARYITDVITVQLS
jgi:putative flavoprotein involved in K+ transport